tara:strand:+ start:362 stop:1180 length:819 start_codon:yes stop_codon:yes gene_type:complete
MPSITLRLKNPLQTLDGTGVDVTPNTPIFGLRQEITVVSIGQAVATSSNVTFNDVSSSVLNLGDGELLLKDGSITGSISHSGNFTVRDNLTFNNNLSVNGTLFAEKINGIQTEAFNIFESGSTSFGDTNDDTHSITGSLNISGSFKKDAFEMLKISDDVTLSGSNSNFLVTENSIIRNYGEKNLYLRKISANIANIENSNTASFNAVTASAPSGLTATSKNDFMFFVNGMIMEHDALNLQQSGSKLLLKVDSNNIGYDLQSTDEIVGWGKFN